jgi:hypothetical protein
MRDRYGEGIFDRTTCDRLIKLVDAAEQWWVVRVPRSKFEHSACRYCGGDARRLTAASSSALSTPVTPSLQQSGGAFLMMFCVCL